MHRYSKKICALLVAAVLVIGIFSPAAFAASAPKAIKGTLTFTSASDAMGLSEKNVSSTAPFYYNDNWFAKPSTVYNHELARMSLNMNRASWTAAEPSNSFNRNAKANSIGYSKAAAYIDKLYKDIGFKPIRYFYYATSMDDESDKVAYSFAEKWLTLNGKSCVVLSVTMRGGNYGGEWVSNGYVGDTDAHQGFKTAAQDVQKQLEKQINSYKKGTQIKLWVNGFSRSGSVGNLLVAALDRKIEQGKCRLKNADIFCYNFAVPLCTKDTDTGNKIYKNIFNINNPVDIIMVAPMRGWGFGRYGVMKCLNFLEAGEKYNRLDKEFAKAFAGKTDEKFTYHLVPWEQFKTLYLIDNIVTVILPTTGDLAGFEPAMRGLIRSFFVQETLIPNIEAGDWASAYAGIMGKDPMWDTVSKITGAAVLPINTVGEWVGNGTNTVDTGLLNFIVCLISRMVEQVAKQPPNAAKIAAQIPTLVTAIVKYAAAKSNPADVEQGFTDNIKIAHSTESYAVLMGLPEAEAFGTGEIKGLSVF